MATLNEVKVVISTGEATTSLEKLTSASKSAKSGMEGMGQGASGAGIRLSDLKSMANLSSDNLIKVASGAAKLAPALLGVGVALAAANKAFKMAAEGIDSLAKKSGAAGDAARNYQRQQDALKDSMTMFKEELAQGLLPLFSPLVSGLQSVADAFIGTSAASRKLKESLADSKTSVQEFLATQREMRETSAAGKAMKELGKVYAEQSDKIEATMGNLTSAIWSAQEKMKTARGVDLITTQTDLAKLNTAYKEQAELKKELDADLLIAQQEVVNKFKTPITAAIGSIKAATKEYDPMIGIAQRMAAENASLTEQYVKQMDTIEILSNAYHQYGVTAEVANRAITKAKMSLVKAQIAERDNINDITAIELTANEKIIQKYKDKEATLTASGLSTAEALKRIESQKNRDLMTLAQEEADKDFALIDARVAKEQAAASERIRIAKEEAAMKAQIAYQHQQDVLGIASQASALITQGVNQYYSAMEMRASEAYDKEKKQIEDSVMGNRARTAALKQMEEKHAKERKKMAHDAAVANKALGIVSATISTAQAVTGALAAPPIPGSPWNIAMATAIGALGAAQIGLIASQPIPAMDRGGFLPAGQVALVGEKRPEIVSSPTLIRGPTNVTSGADTARILGAMQGSPGETVNNNSTETVNVSVNVVDGNGNTVQNIRQALNSGEFMPLFADIVQKAKRQGVLV